MPISPYFLTNDRTFIIASSMDVRSVDNTIILIYEQYSLIASCNSNLVSGLKIFGFFEK